MPQHGGGFVAIALAAIPWINLALSIIIFIIMVVILDQIFKKPKESFEQKEKFNHYD